MSNQSIQNERANINFHKYFDGIFVVAKKEFYRVFLWMYKGGSQYVGEYLKSTPRGMRRLKSNERAALNRREIPVLFDIPFLYTLMQHTCGLAEDTSDIWHNPQTPSETRSLEHSLYLLKEKRNALCHEPQTLMHMSKTELDQKLDELGNLCKIIIQKAGQKAKRSNNEVDNWIKKMEEALDEIKTRTSPSGFSASKFSILAKEEIKKKCFYSPDLFNTFVKPSLHVRSKTGEYSIQLSNFVGWLCEDGTLPTKIVMNGNTGTGKSSICQYLYLSWAYGNSNIADMSNFDIVIPLLCYKAATRDLVDFLEEYLSDTISQCGRDETREFLKTLKILWLIDGFEDATVDARELLRNIEKQGASHLMFITTALQHRQGLSDILSLENKVLEVDLSGLSIEGAKLLVTKVLNEKEKDFSASEIKAQRFLKDAEGLGKVLLLEFLVPLKLKLMLELWESGKLSRECGTSLSLLYTAITDAQLERLQKKMELKTTLRKEEILKRSKSWFKVLCEVSFDMTLQKRFVHIDGSFIKKLEEKAENLVISCEDSLSIFLHSQSSTVAESLYTFSHSSQQFFLAAQNVLYLLENHPTPGQLVKDLFMSEILLQNQLNSSHLYATLLHVVSKVTLQPDKELVESLVLLLSQCREWNPFEAVQYAEYSTAFTKEISKFSKKEWIVSHPEAKAATSLLEYANPYSIDLDIYCDPKRLECFSRLIEILSERNIFIGCRLKHDFTTLNSDISDRYIARLCSSDALCTILNFGGYLSERGCQYLSKMPQVKALALKITSNKILKKLSYYLNNLDQLSLLYLNITMPLAAHISFPELKCKFIAVNLHQVKVCEERSTARFLSRISKEYVYITLFNLSADSAIKFIETLMKEKVRVQSIVRELPIGKHEEEGFYRVNFGPVPPLHPLPVLQDQWLNTRIEEFEDTLGNKNIGVRVKMLQPKMEIQRGFLPEYCWP